MRDTRLIMGMPVRLEVVEHGEEASAREAMERVFEYFQAVDERFSTYKEGSEISRINRGEIIEREYSPEMQEVIALAEKTKKETGGYFDIRKPGCLPADRRGSLDPSGIVKGWAIHNAAQLLESLGFVDFFVDAGGDVQVSGHNSEGGEWSVGIRNPFKQEEIVKVVYPRGAGVATSGSYVRGAHIYNPHEPNDTLDEVVSITVLGPDVCEADRFATAAFAMGRGGITFIGRLSGFEGYAIDKSGLATMTNGFERYTRL